ncbi:MAG: hypothetical protein BGO53_00245 [Sphingobacteriales bacterium 39-19]|nr:hypothetical protein [Sphingobacteriales bacterium]OJW09122.1 MAG: hypothetical protein BGO53_00245 [Sphingobacteriales bacterium 39-19]
MHNPYYLPYQDAMKQLSLSTHIHQLQKRQKKYPLHFMQQGSEVYISIVLFEALKDYKAASDYLLALKKGGVK